MSLRKVRTFTCASCGASVTKRAKPDQSYCSLECYRTGKRPTRCTGVHAPCAWCGEAVYVPAHRLGQTQYFCHPQHANLWQARNRPKSVCKMCGEEVQRPLSHTKATTYCSLKCRDADPEYRAKIVGALSNQQRLCPNKVEKAGYALLDLLGVPYLAQHLIAGKFCVDALLPEAKVVVQFDGNYWHGHPEMFPALSARQRHRRKLDRSQDAYLKKCGYTVVRVWERDIKACPSEVESRLRSLLQTA
jgi:very-short-patch-repair endonuclease